MPLQKVSNCRHLKSRAAVLLSEAICSGLACIDLLPVFALGLDEGTSILLLWHEEHEALASVWGGHAGQPKFLQKNRRNSRSEELWLCPGLNYIVDSEAIELQMNRCHMAMNSKQRRKNPSKQKRHILTD